MFWCITWIKAYGARAHKQGLELNSAPEELQEVHYYVERKTHSILAHCRKHQPYNLIFGIKDDDSYAISKLDTKLWAASRSSRLIANIFSIDLRFSKLLTPTRFR